LILKIFPRQPHNPSLADEAGPWDGFKTLLDVQLGDARAGLSGPKSCLLEFG
jgi:hypothetical protein